MNLKAQIFEEYLTKSCGLCMSPYFNNPYIFEQRERLLITPRHKLTRQPSEFRIRIKDQALNA